MSSMDVAVAASQEQAAMEAPMSSSLGAIGPLLRKLDILLAPEYRLRRSLKHAIELLKADVEEVSAALVEQSMVDSPSNKAKYWMGEVRHLSYDMEDCIDNLMRSHSATGTKVRSVHHFKVARPKINRLPKLLRQSSRMARITEIRALLREASERHERYQLDGCSSDPPKFAFTGGTHSRVNSELCKTSANLVGVKDSRKELTEWLINHEEKQLKVLCIIGAAGVGKTTLTRSLCRELKGQFECRAFIRVSRKPDMSKIIGEILSQVQGPKQTPDGNSLQNSIDCVREHLQDKRYFIVVDDLWDTTPWDILSNAFPKGNNCSRVIITAELQDVAAECNGHHSVTSFEMKPLVSQDSEKLLLQRVFGSEHHCPDQLKEVSSRIIRASGGLPLGIIMMAGLLASELDNTGLWNQLVQCFFPSLAILTLELILEKIVNLCYSGLPLSLKTCLLYLTRFPEGSTIWKVDLLKQWIAEGFISTTEGKEGVPESYFDELVSRGMIQPVKINHNDEVISFTVHHVVFDLISHKSREEKFVTVVDYSQTITVCPTKVHRLSLQFSCATYASKPEGIKLSQIRSLAFLGLQGCMPSITEFKHLRVLNLELCGNYDDCTTLNLSGLGRLFQLRYLKVACHISVELPSQMHDLQFLETLEIDAKLSNLPVDIASLKSLLHLSFRDGTKLPHGVGRITSLQTLKYFDLGKNSEDNVRSLGGLVNLHELHLTFSGAAADEHLKRKLVALSYTVGKLANLRSLTLAPISVGITMFVDHSYVMPSVPMVVQRLELLSPICTFYKLPQWVSQLQMLRTLKCCLRELLQVDIESLAGLPVLTSLSLFIRRSTSENVVFHSGAFPGLKYFKYRCGGELCLVFEDEALPNLQIMKLGFNIQRGDQCGHMISGIEYLYKLKKIALEIGAADGADESDKRAAEIAFRDATQKHTRNCFLDIRTVDRIQEEKILYAQPIVKSLGSSKNAVDDIIRIPSGFDNRLPLMSNLFHPPAGATAHAVDSITEIEEMGEREDKPGPDDANPDEVRDAEKEFRHLLSCRPRARARVVNNRLQASEGDDSISTCGKKPFSDDEISSYLISPENVGILMDIADIMMRAGYVLKLRQAYIEARRDSLMECLAVLGVDKMSLGEVQLVECKVLDDKTKKWIHALKVFVRSLLPQECRICSQILAADANPQECFTEVAKEPVLQLLSFGDAVATGKTSPMYKALAEELPELEVSTGKTSPMYKALAEVLPELEALFSGETRDFIKEEAERILVKLGDAVPERLTLKASPEVETKTSNHDKEAVTDRSRADLTPTYEKKAALAATIIALFTGSLYTKVDSPTMRSHRFQAFIISNALAFCASISVIIILLCEGIWKDLDFWICNKSFIKKLMRLAYAAAIISLAIVLGTIMSPHLPQ